MHGRAPISAVLATLIALLGSAGAPARAQSVAGSSDGLWQIATVNRSGSSSPRADLTGPHTIVQLDRAALDARLALAPKEGTLGRSATTGSGATGSGANAGSQDAVTAVLISLPLPDGRFSRFTVEDSPILAPELAAAFPHTKTYRAVGLDDPTATARLDVTDAGFHAQILAAGGTVYIDPLVAGERILHVAFDKTALARPDVSWRDEVLGTIAADANRTYNQLPMTNGTVLRTYRLALAATAEYTTAAGGTKALALARMTTTMNRVNGILERELAVHLTVATGSVADPTALIYTDASTDPYTNLSPSTMLAENQTALDAVVGSANYDMGHVFGTGGGGVAYLQAICNSALKGQGVTGLPNPTGETFAVDYVSHEMGHQFGANHSFNSSSGSCGANRASTHAYEVGSGITIMSYSGLCAPENTGFDSLDRYSFESLNEMTTFITSGGGATCGSTAVTGNALPVVTGPGASFTIPAQTPFALTAIATDSNGDALTYAWEEQDRNNLGTANPWGTDDGVSPLFRSYAPTTSGTRYFPSLQYILNNANVPPASTACSGTTCITGELLPATTRTMTFMVTVRDNHAGGGAIATQQTAVSVNSAVGPFAVSSPQGGENWPASTTQTITWAVNGTNALAANVAILLSTDGGLTFPITLAASTANDGSESVQLPAATSTTARIKVQAVGNIFFDISNANFTISTPTVAPGALSKAGPANGATDVSLSPALAWSAAAGTSTYEYCLDTTANNSCDSGWTSITTLTTDTVSGLAPATTYSWQVRARNAAGTTDADAGAWFTFTTAALTNPRADLLLDFGPAWGLWAYYDAGGTPRWDRPNLLSPTTFAVGDIDGNGQSDIVGSFAGYGIWAFMNNTTWVQLHGYEASVIATGDLDGNGRDNVVVNFANHLGVWALYEGAGWVQLQAQTASVLAVGNINGSIGGRAEVIAAFGASGTWIFRDNTTWVSLHPLPAQALQVADVDGNGVGDVIAQFDGYGEWIYFNSTTWTPLHLTAAAGFVAGNVNGDPGHKADVVVNFPGYGVWAWLDNSSWVAIHSMNANAMAIGDVDGNGQADIILSFPGYGTWIYLNQTSWMQIHALNPEALASGRLNSN